MSKKSNQSILQDVIYPRRWEQRGVYLYHTDINQTLFASIQVMFNLPAVNFSCDVKDKGNTRNPSPEKVHR